MTNIGLTNINFSDLRTKWSLTTPSFLKSDESSGSGPGTTNISLSEFRDALFTDETSVPTGNSEISINTHFKNKTFGEATESNNSFTTGDFNFELTFSGEQDRLYPVSSSTSTTSTSSSKHSRLFHSNVSYSYSSMLLCPQTGNPTIGTKDDATVWIKMKLNSPYHFQVGIIHKQGENTWTNVASTALRNRHTTYNDRIALHTYGYVTHAGHDVESNSKTDELMDITITNETTINNYHNRIGTTAGSGDGFTTLSNTYYYLQSDVDFFQSKTSTSSEYHVGMKLNYYEITLTGTVTNNLKLITNVKLNNSNLTEDDNVYSGMYLKSTQSDPYFPSEAIIQSIRYNTSNNTEIDMGDEINGSVDKTYGYYGSTITFKAFGQRLEFQYADSLCVLPKNIGPNHIILPRKYRTSSNGSNLDIDSWAFFVGDSTTGTNSATFSIQNNNPSLYPDITSNFLEISNQFISAPSSSDHTGHYDVSETEIGLSGNHRLYIGFKATSSVHYYSDICIAAIQVVNSSGENKSNQTWIFDSSSHSHWKTKEGTIGIQSENGFPITPYTASNHSYSTLSTSAIYDRASLATGTTSSYTGAADGIDGTTETLSPGNGTMSQSPSTYYLFRETSGTSSLITNSGVVIQSPIITLACGDKIRVAHLMVGHGSHPMDANDSLYLGAYADNSGP